MQQPGERRELSDTRGPGQSRPRRGSPALGLEPAALEETGPGVWSGGRGPAWSQPRGQDGWEGAPGIAGHPAAARAGKLPKGSGRAYNSRTLGPAS